MHHVALQALDLAAQRGVQYADVRLVESKSQDLSTRNGRVSQVADAESVGMAIRMLVDGGWGFAATDDLTPAGVEKAVTMARAIARASTMALKNAARLADEPVHRAKWASPCTIDPFGISVTKKLDHLLRVDEAMRANKAVTLTETLFHANRARQFFVNTEGSEIEQTRTMTGAGCACYVFEDGDLQKRSYPNSFGGQYQLKGWELVEEIDMLSQASRLAEEAAALHSADVCPAGEFTLILDSSQLGLQIHESIGHPIELDRVLGSEANYAGMSFLTVDQLRKLQYGSPLVHVVSDATLEHGPGLGTFAFDDEGVAAQRTDIIREGLFTGYLTSRETAGAIGATRSNGCLRAAGWDRLPLIRMTNTSLEPGTSTLEEVFDVPHAIYMETNKSWSIDDKRYNFQFGCEVAWEIRNGKRVRMLKNPVYSGISTQFWNACQAIANREHWTLWGVPNCGKGQPEQVMGTGHGASPSRFGEISVGSL
ncbi:MAG: TldD/PmbA family protein [Acidobacteria bacterium]|nr:TldD/PmbA family protein [Acidobacteriota bacterium]